MPHIAIAIEGLGKQYVIGRRQEPYRTFREALVEASLSPIRRLLTPGPRQAPETIWALKDVSLEIKHGEVVGIIGRNGAGKSTLLKILSRITEPTVGTAVFRGRLNSLLEVGTGFHPELTGRENIYLNGSLLGMRRLAIAKKFDEIVAFAEVAPFIDTPVKHYSSGMYLRLAFAVAAHLDADILLVDEVLAVGDARFQLKCLDRMRLSAQSGRTVIFVSHDMAATARLCDRGILLEAGRIREDGPANQVIGKYLTSGLGTTAAREWNDPRSAPAGDVARLRAVRVTSADGAVASTIDIRHPFQIEMHYDVLREGAIVLPGLLFTNETGVDVFAPHDLDPEWRGRPRPAGRYVSTAWIPGNLLAEGTLRVSVACETVAPARGQFFERDAVAFQVIDTLDGDSARGDYGGQMGGVMRPLLRWTTSFTPCDPD